MWRLALLTIGLSLPALAQDEPYTGPTLQDSMHARNVGMGGAYEALGYGAEAAAGNPAAMTLYKRYQSEVSGSWDLATGYGLTTVALVDSVTSNVAAGLSYHFVTWGEGPERRWAHLTSFGLALPLADFLHIGVTTRHQVITGATDANSITMTGGVVIRPLQFLSIGFSAHNFIPVYSRDVPLYFVGSLGVMLANQLSAAFDVRMDPSGGTLGLTYSGGLEWLLAQTFPLRGGFTWDDVTQSKAATVGVGYFSEGSGVDFSYRHEIGGNEGRMFALTLKLQM